MEPNYINKSSVTMVVVAYKDLAVGNVQEARSSVSYRYIATTGASVWAQGFSFLAQCLLALLVNESF